MPRNPFWKIRIDAAEDLTRRIYEELSTNRGILRRPPLSVVMRERKVYARISRTAISCIGRLVYRRYVSGYIETFSPEGVEKLMEQMLPHAWFSVYIPPGLGRF